MTAKKESKKTSNGIPTEGKSKPTESKSSRPTKKLKSKKLEERIAPGMLGGGVVDPGSIENVDTTQTDDLTNTSSGDISNTNIDSTASGTPSGEQSSYVDDNYNNQSSTSTSTSPSDGYNQQDDYNSNSNYGDDEFTNSQTQDNFIHETPTWQEPDWVTANADGSVHVAPPEGVTIDPTQGIANFSPEIANEVLPIPDYVNIQTDGTINLSMPEGTQYNPDTNSLTLTSNTVDIKEIPAELNPVQNPDGTINMTLPPDGGMNYDPQTNTLNVNNYYANEMAPDPLTINENGSVDVKLPENGVTYNPDGSIDMTAEASHSMDNPAPEYVHDITFADYQPNGSVTFDPPTGMVVDGGIMTVPNDMLPQLPMDENFTINTDGTANYALPEGTQYNADVNAITLPQGEVYMNQIPDSIDAHVNPDQTITAYLPEGVNYNVDTNAVQMDNYWANQVTPDQVNINTDGSVSVALPSETQYFNDGSFNIPQDQVDFLDHPAPDYVHDVPFSEYMGDGNYQITPPENFQVNVDTGTMYVPPEAIQSLPIPEDFTINNDGTIDVKVPEGTEYNSTTSMLTFPQGTVPISDLPPETYPIVNPDGTISATLPDGMQYDPQNLSVHMDNYWANEVAPAPVEINSQGGIIITLPEDTTFNPDGSFNLTSGSADFLHDSPPAYVMNGPDWVNTNPDGSVTFEKTDGWQVNPDQGQMTMNYDYMAQNFQNYIPPEIHFTPEGTMSVDIPQGTTYNAEAGIVTFPVGEVHTNEIPPALESMVNPDGSVSIKLQDGMTFDTQNMQMKFDNYWTNELTPPAVEFQPNGQVTVDLPANTQYFPHGDFTIPVDSTGFIDNPPPAYVMDGPDWISPNPDGSITFEKTDGWQVNPEQGQMTMNYDYMAQNFQNYIPPELHFTPEGTMNVDVPQGTQYNPDTGTLTFPAGEVHLNEIPSNFESNLYPDGRVSVLLPDGITYDPQNMQVQLDNYWTNEVTPPAVEFAPNGQIIVGLPPTTQYFPEGDFTIPADSTGFIDNPPPPYIMDGPGWISPNPDGSITFEKTDGWQINPDQGQMTMNYDYMTNNFQNYIPPEIHFTPEGTMNVDIPQGTTYNADAGIVTFPVGEVHTNELPPVLEPIVNPDGSISIKLQDGMTFDAQNMQMKFDNYWTNELTPPAVDFVPNGQVIVNLPPYTQYYPQGDFTIPPESAGFIDNPLPAYVTEGPDWAHVEPNGAVTVTIPESLNIDVSPSTGTLTMDYTTASAEFKDIIPPDMSLNADGSADIKVPEGTLYDVSANTLTFPSGTVHLNDFPQEINATYNPNGTITATMPEGMQYNSQVATLHISNEWLNNMAPEPVQIDTNGTITITLPPGTQYFNNGESFVIPAEQANFMNPQTGPTEFTINDPSYQAGTYQKVG
ncbi:MAG: hypothetical protein HQK51_05740 [Oligoflexia bacterium]|nr:hypothetical protein [Oligoflexia bacterium]